MKETMFASTIAYLEPSEAMNNLKRAVDSLIVETDNQMGSTPWRVESSSHAVTAIPATMTRKTGMLGWSTESIAVTKYLATAFLVITVDPSRT